MPIREVMVPHDPTTFPETVPGCRKEYATGRSTSSLMQSMIKSLAWALFSLSVLIS